MDFNPYSGQGAHLAAALANHTESDPRSLRRLLEEHGMEVPAVEEADVAEAHEWSALLGAVFGSQSTDKKVAAINDLLARSASRPFVSCHDGRPPHLHFAREREPFMSRVRAFTAVGVAVMLCDAGGHRLGRCAALDCGLAFVDTSKNGRRRFCTVKCANRTYVAEHRHRRRTAS
ncbi:hypothetical protein Misp01_55280 [Microtetraspora sp. NBRC 13810]|uniref:CGNR zinc finger domain-containing protein n=1 Tax=Microtetraspora sp. NBRC 13810 TaxID=3030990 RepID=UPI0024A30CF0|nr:CGNR zinc finger domain-containing protein [Microtetraspora sp. NBRC 13810]GLW10400.1 hypothetical protein Misp01_55280 [Microtetraspora sp. NBRC 13810]